MRVSCCLLLALCSILQSAPAAEALSEEDENIMRLLQPISRSALPGWMEAHERLAAEVGAASRTVSLLSSCPLGCAALVSPLSPRQPLLV